MTSASRSPRAFWGDVRFFIGIALVLLSVAGVWLIVGSARDTTPVLQSTRTIVAGEVLTSGDFRTVEVSIGALSDGYLSPGQLAPGLIAARTIDSGELVPTAATAPAGSARTTTIVIDSAVGLSESILPGSVVELWHAPSVPETRTFEHPRILVSDVTVAAVLRPQGMIAQGPASLEIVIDRSDVAAVLAAITDGSALSVVPVGSRT